MARKQLLALFICNLTPYLIGNSLLPLLPFYVRQKGAGAGITGIYLALAFGALTAGTLAGGWLAGKTIRRKATIAASASLASLALVLMGVVGHLVGLVVAIVICWFVCGVQLATVSILTGALASAGRRGVVFGVVGSSLAMGGLIAGLFAGRVVDRWGFDALFAGLAVVVLVPAVVAQGLAVPRGAAVPVRTRHQGIAAVTHPAIWLLLGASTLAYVSHFMGGLGRPLAMGQLGFDSTAISSTGAIAGAVNLPLPFLIGWLSDRVGRRPLLVLCYLAGAAGVGSVLVASSLWHFWTSQVFSAVLGVSLSVGPALMADMVPEEARSASLARFAATPWLGGVVGYAGAGAVIETAGLAAALSVGLLLPLGSVLLVMLGRTARPVPTPDALKRTTTTLAVATAAPGR